MFRSFKEIRNRVRTLGAPRRVAIPAADDETSIETAIAAKRGGIADPILIGAAPAIERLLKKKDAKPSAFAIIDGPGDAQSAALAVRLVRGGKADLILKGRLDTPTLLKVCLDRKTGLRTGRLLSDVLVFEDPLWSHRGGRLCAITDGGITPAPNLAQKRQIIENAVEVFHRLGCRRPRVAVMSATEKVDPRIASTADASALVDLCARGVVKGCIVEGPMALDVAALDWCARVKGIRSRMAGAVDIMLMPNFEAGNILAKAFVFFMNRRIGHVIAGARAPILINSRTDPPAQRLNSIALSILVGPGSGSLVRPEPETPHRIRRAE